MTRYNNILETIGDTPLVRLSRLAPEGVNVYVKVEAFNPMGSVKDRMARAVIEHAERSGELSPGQTVIEATSGNTGIALAMVCAQKGYPLVVIMTENSSVERRKIMRFLGAQVILTPAADKGTGMLAKAVELAEAHGYYLCQQFDNEVNAAVHTSTTGPEILRDMGGEPLHYWLSGFGTGGTLKGVARFLKSESPNTRIVATEPDNSPVLASGIAQPRDAQGNATVSHPSFRPHPMQGWSPDFISGLTESAFAENWVDQVLPVAGDDAMRLCRELACKEGIFAGITGGATLAGALQIAADAPRGTNIVCMLPDTGERYLSTPLFADIGEDMNQEEIFLSRSTAGYQFETAQPEKVAPAPAPAPVPAETVTLDVEAKELVDSLVANEGVVMFALEWCEFCWSVRKLLEAMGVEYRSIDLDSVAYQAGDQGGKIRQVLADTLKSPTIPQIFVAGEHIGGATDLIAGCEDGSLQRRLDKAGISYVPELSMSPAEFLPQWLHPRKRA
jgi:cysteine synthase A